MQRRKSGESRMKKKIRGFGRVSVPRRLAPAGTALAKTMFAVFMTGAMLLMFAGCSTWDSFVSGLSDEETEEVVRIGIFEPITGDDKEMGALEIQGIELAHELYPDALGKPVELFYGDNKSDVNVAEDAAKELVDERVAVVLGSYTSTLSLVGGEIFAEAKIPMIGITCTNPLVTAVNDYAARVCFVDSFQGNAAAKYVYESLHLEKAAVLSEAENDYAAAMAQQFSDKLASLTGDPNAVVKTVNYAKGTEDFSGQLAQLQLTGTNVVYFPSGLEDALTVFEEAKGLGLTFIGTDTWGTQEFLERGGSSVEGAVYTAIFDAETNLSDRTNVFLESYAKKYGRDKTPESAVALGFDAYVVAREAINRAGTALDGDAIMAEMIKIKELPGATGLITLSENGDPIKPVAINIVSGGAFVHEYTAEPVWGQ